MILAFHIPPVMLLLHVFFGNKKFDIRLLY